MISSLGANISASILSEKLIKSLEFLCNKDEVKKFTQNLCKWQIEFIQRNDGTVITTGAFSAYCKNYHIVETALNYILNPLPNALTEELFIKELYTKMDNYLNDTLGRKITLDDSNLIYIFWYNFLVCVRNFFFREHQKNNKGCSIWLAKTT